MKTGNKRQFYFRADGNEKIGTGHLMRCLTIADALAQVLGESGGITFLTADEQSADLLRSRIQNSEKGKAGQAYQVISLGTDYRKMEEELVSLERFFGVNREEVSQARRCFVVDSYQVTDAYLTALGTLGEVWLLDDMEQHRFPVKAVVNYNLYASYAKYQQLYNGAGTEYYTGSQYVPIRSQFLNRDYIVRERVENILITTGGSDYSNIAKQILNTIQDDRYQYHIVTGRFNPHLREWREVEQTNPNIHVHYDVQDMAGLMKVCDVAITAGGSTVYELSALGIPFICFSYAENQEALAACLGQHEIAAYAGAFHKEPQEVLTQIKRQICQMAEDVEIRKRYSQIAKEMIDGKGALRIAKLLAGIQI